MKKRLVLMTSALMTIGLLEGDLYEVTKVFTSK